MASLQDQLLKAGLVDKKKAKTIKKTKTKQTKAAHKSKQPVVDESKQAVKKAQQAKAAADKALNEKKNAREEQKAVMAQIKQIVQLNKITHYKGDTGYNFVDGTTVKKLYISDGIANDLSKGRLAIAKLTDANNVSYHLIPAKAAEKITQRHADSILLLNDKQDNDTDEDDPYAEFQIPDDLMW